MRGIDVACVVFLVRHQFNPVLFIGNDITETVAFHILRQSGCCEDTVNSLLGNVLVLGKDPFLFQLQLQGLTLGKSNRETLVMEFQHSEVSLSVPKELRFIYIPAYQRDHLEQESHFIKRQWFSTLVITD